MELEKNKNLGSRIKKIRIEKGITQQQLANLTGYTDTMISKVENGARGLSLEGLETIAKALKVKPDFLAGWNDKPNQNEDPYYVDTSMLTEAQHTELNMLLKQHNGLLMLSGVEPTEHDKKELNRLITLSYLKSLGIIKMR